MTTTIDKKTYDAAQTAFIRARIHLLTHHPFYAHLTMKLKLEWWEDAPGGLSCTDGTSLYINPVEFIKLTKLQQVTVLVHEVLHPACGHLWRRGSRDPQRWNMAADIAIDNLIHADKFEAGPWEQSREQWLRSVGYRVADFQGTVAEVIYDKLPQPPQQQGGCACGSGSGPQGPQGCLKEPGKGDASAKDGGAATEADWKQNVIAAGQLAGKAAGAWQELVKAAMPKPPFHLKLFEYLNRGLGGDSDWGALNRRCMWRGLYLPTETRTVMGRIACFVDTSGSMSSGEPKAQLNLALGYIRSFRDSHPCDMDLVQCDYDAALDAQYKFYPEFEQLPESFEIIGRGGTSFDPPFKLLREKRIEPRVAIYFTDGYGSCSVPKPSYPVLWVVIGGNRGFKPPFGEVVHAESTAS